MQNQASLQETKQHGAVRFPFNLYPCTIPGDFPQVALHWQDFDCFMWYIWKYRCQTCFPQGVFENKENDEYFASTSGIQGCFTQDPAVLVETD